MSADAHTPPHEAKEGGLISARASVDTGETLPIAKHSLHSLESPGEKKRERESKS